MASGIRKKKGDIVMDKTWDDRIKQSIKTELEAIELGEQAEKESLLEIHKMVIERRSIMKFTKRKMAGAIAAALAIMVMGAATAVAAGKITGMIITTDKREAVYSTAELLQKAGEQMGAVPKLVDTFSNGMAFNEGNITKVKGVDENQNEVSSYQEVSAEYGENNRVALSVHKQQDPVPQEPDAVKKKEIYQEIPLLAAEYNYLLLPPDAQPSEEDLKLQEEGKLMITYGSSEEERKLFRSVSWSENGMDYLLFTTEDIELDNLIGMAKEIIDVK